MLWEQVVPRIAEQLRRDLESPHGGEREDALDRLGGVQGSHQAVFTASLNDPDPEVRETAAVNLGQTRHPDAWPTLVEAARRESSDDVLRQVIWAFSLYSSPRILDLLLEILREQSERDHLVRMEVVVQLWKYDRPDVVDILREMSVTDDSHIVRGHAADSLKVLDELGGRGPVRDVTEVLMRHLRLPDSKERSHALHRLMMLNPEDALERALPLLDDTEASVRGSCCLCLGSIRDPRAAAPLLSVLASDHDASVQALVLVALEEYHSEEIGESLLRVLKAPYLTAESLPILYRQLWKYPSEHTIASLRAGLTSSISALCRQSIEGSLRFLARLDFDS